MKSFEIVNRMNLKQCVAAAPVQAESGERAMYLIGARCVLEMPMRLLRSVCWALGSLAIVAIPVLCTAQVAETEDTTQAKVQTTYVWQRKPAFPAAYSGANSLSPEEEKRS
jgi:hypothetical protein